ncbi:hypothetical protein EHQ58_10255 [Leptospira ognonensis]|uniref:Uncharacterized protein n=1 Tax=Leptospira ognonensis TaxID=2484945 RepID=A0A4R9K1K3_9LEPT|nr:hypothetical protein [Leptospira ognonensis]TGL58690.1 hypothetical protein EHQ58_10255 [Leptospira ognonensis]
MKKDPLTIFSFGYWGWGTEVPTLVKTIDSIEKSRGYTPPVFVDIRMSHAVRAPGFNGNSFQKLLGEKRVINMPELGNRRIVSQRGKRIQIDQPEFAETLLQIAQDASKKNQRIIFFCSCAIPGPEHSPYCHRVTVSGLLLKSGKENKKPLTVVEWPGGDGKIIQAKTDEDTFSKVSRAQKGIPLGKLKSPLNVTAWKALPYSSIIVLNSTKHDHSIHLKTEPTQFVKKQWIVRVEISDIEKASAAKIKALMIKNQKENGYSVRELRNF